MTHQTDVDVLIVGAGPTGLTMACLLAQYGVSFRIIEKNKAISDRSKALAVQARTLELFEQLGISSRAIKAGHPAEGLDLFIRGRQRASIDLKGYGEGLTKYPFLLILEQSKTERLLGDALQALGCEVEWEKKLVDFQQQPELVTAIVWTDGKPETVRAKYLIAADGARSDVRSILKIPFEGGTYENRFLLADVAVSGPVSRRHISLCISHEGFAGFFPMVGTDRFRTIGIIHEYLPENADRELATIEEEVRRQSQLPVTLSDPRWISTYKLHHRNVARFKVQRCFFAGDAAHVHSPAGGQGMNTGIQDSFNLAWKLSWVLKGRARESILETYHEERFPIARRLIHTTDQIFSFVSNRQLFFKFSRLYLVPSVLQVLSKTQVFRSFVFRTISQIGISYRQSPLSQSEVYFEADFKAGDRYCQGLHDGFFHVYLVGGAEDQDKVIAIFESYFNGRIKIHTLTRHPESLTVLQSFGIFKDGLVFIRPDGYAGYCSEGLDPGHLHSYLDQFFLPMGVAPQYQTEEKSSSLSNDTYSSL